ncbi:RNA methyltransferase [Mollicutes bacterium LVI A0039]|nr:RNA methyltransferase [Mollicutes bacterium LVI A0039]
MINSTQNNQVKKLSKLSKRSYRYETKQYIVFGETLAREAIKAGHVTQLFVTDDFDINFEQTKVSSAVMHKIVGEANTKIAALCTMQTTDFDTGSTLILDNIQDPGNLGTMIRSAKAFGINNIFLGLGTVDLYNSKVLRSMQGVNYYVNIQQGDITEYLNHSTNQLITTFLDEPSSDITALDKSSAFDIMFGNEGHGLDPKYKRFERNNIVLDIEFESLNVAIAAGIIMYNLREK